MEGNAPVNLYDCRLMRVCTDDRDYAKSVYVGLDIVRAHGKFAYFDYPDMVEMDCVVPWETWRMETLRDAKLFEDCLKGLENWIAAEIGGTLKGIALAVPYTFTCFQKRMIAESAQKLGIKVMSMDVAGMFSSLSRDMSMFFEDVPDDGETPDGVCLREIICNLWDKSFEVSVIETRDGCHESLGTVGITCAEGWDSLPGDEFERRMKSELKQFFRDLRFEKDEEGRWLTGIDRPDGTEETEYRVYMCGRRNRFIDEWLLETTGRDPEPDAGSDAVGCLYQCLSRAQRAGWDSFRRVTAQNRTVWAALGDNGERAVLLNRYERLPACNSAALLVSTERQLRIYEGNFMNPRFDCLLDELSLDGLDAEEGREIECRLDVGLDEMFRLTVLNAAGETLIEDYRL